MKNKALFLDRDGVINIDSGYVWQPADFRFVEGIFELCLAAQSKGYLLIVVTNQAGIGRGYYSEEDFWHITRHMQAEFARRGITIHAVYFSPYLPEHGIGRYKKQTDCRKPGPGMILQAAKDHAIDLGASILIGDRITDIMAGSAAGVGVRILLGQECIDQLKAPNDMAIHKLHDAIAHL